MHTYRGYAAHVHDSLNADQKPLVGDLIATHYVKSQTPPPSPNGKCTKSPQNGITMTC